MKKILSLLLCGMILLQLSACTKLEVTPAPEVAAIRNDAISYPDGAIEYDNEASAKDLPVTKKKEILDNWWALEDMGSAAWSSSQLVSWQGLQTAFGEENIYLRYHYGRYYAVMRGDDGSYLLVLFEEHGPTSVDLIAVDSCFVKCLSDFQKADRLQIGDSLQKVKRNLSNFVQRFSSGSETVEYSSRCSDLTTRIYIFADGKLKETRSALPENSVLTYLLPQDLALIS